MWKTPKTRKNCVKFASYHGRRNCALYMQNFRLKYAKIAYNYKRIIKEIIKEFLLTTYYYGAYARSEKSKSFSFLVDKSGRYTNCTKKKPLPY